MSLELKLGNDLSFGPDQLVQVQLKSGIDTLYGALQADSLQATVRSTADGESHALQEQKVQLYRGDQLLATHSIKACRRDAAGQFALSCRTNQEFLEGEFMGGMYENEDPLMLVDWILTDRSFSMDSVIANRTITGYLPICTRAQALRQVAIALGAVVSVDERGSFCFRALAQEPQQELPSDRILSGAALTTRPGYTRVELVSHSYEPATEWVELYHRKEFGNDPVTLTFTTPNYDYDVGDGVLVESGPNFVTFQPSNFMSISVKPYIHTATYHTLNGPQTEIGGFSQVLSVRDVTLVNPENAQQVLQWLYERARLRQELTLKARIEGEKVGQMVTAPTPWGTQVTGYIAQMDSVFTGEGHMAELTILGTESKNGEN